MKVVRERHRPLKEHCPELHAGRDTVEPVAQDEHPYGKGESMRAETTAERIVSLWIFHEPSTRLSSSTDTTSNDCWDRVVSYWTATSHLAGEHSRI